MVLGAGRGRRRGHDRLVGCIVAGRKLSGQKMTPGPNAGTYIHTQHTRTTNLCLASESGNRCLRVCFIQEFLGPPDRHIFYKYLCQFVRE